jgi:NAD(P)-dependent dehydrogenase (short-subunit alcohol dehydrogenase family)
VSLRGKTALVTGTSRGIGRAIARALAKEGARVLCHARIDADARALADELGGVPIVGDLSSEAGVDAVTEQTLATASALHVLVHNAATNPRAHESFDEVDREVFREVVRVNVEAPLFLTQALLEPLRAANGARVILVSSQAGQFAGGMPADGLSYRVSKAALNAVSAVAATALRSNAILVNAMHPGWVRTDMGGPDAPLSPEEGADTAVYLAKLPDDGPSGRFFYERRVIDW